MQDFESKGYLTKKNVDKLIQILIGSNELSEDDIKKLVDKVYDFLYADLVSILLENPSQIFQEADIDHNQKITPDEFDHIVTKSADFSK